MQNTLRELRFNAGGIQLGEPLKGFKGVLTGTPDPMETPNSHAKGS